MSLSRLVIGAILSVQVLSALFFFADIWGEILGLRREPWPWAVTEFTQVFASLGIVIGVAVTSVVLWRSQRRLSHLGRQFSAISGQYETQLQRHFADWGLSQSEQAITVYAMKGFSNAEIGDLRGTSVSTVKSQMNAIYRKTGFSNRQQLISFLVEELIAGVADPLPPAASPASPRPDAIPLAAE